MDAMLNVSYITLDGYADIAQYRYVFFVFVFAFYIVIICSNSTIICLIWIHQNLHEPMYIFIAALSVNSVLYSTVVYPKMLVDALSERQTISYSACLLQYFLYYSLGGADFFLLSAMAYDRYVSICKPLQYPAIMTKITVRVFLGLSWILPLCQAGPGVSLSVQKKLCHFVLGGIFCNNSINKLQCVRSVALSVIGVFAFVNTALVPLAFIVCTYIKIFLITYHSCGKVRRKAAETCLPHLLVLVCFFSLCAFDLVIDKLEYSLPKTVRVMMTLQMVVYHPMFNPIIYGLKMKHIAKHLKGIFCWDKSK